MNLFPLVSYRKWLLGVVVLVSIAQAWVYAVPLAIKKMVK